MADDPMDVDQRAQGEGDDNQNVEGGGINRPLVQLPRFRVVRHHDDFLNRVIAHRVPIAGIDGGVPVPVLHKYLRWYEGIAGFNAGYDLLSADEVEGAAELLSTLTEEEWQRASPAQNYDDFVRVFATGPDNVEYELQLRHGVHENEPPFYDLTHGWRRIVNDYGLLEGDYVEGEGYRDVEGDQLRFELRFHRDYINLNGKRKGKGEGEGEGEGEGGGSAAAKPPFVTCRVFVEHDFLNQGREGTVHLEAKVLPALWLDRHQYVGAEHLNHCMANCEKLLKNLTEEEIRKLKRGGILPVFAFDSKGLNWELNLLQPAGGAAYFLGDWSKMLNLNKPKDGDVVNVWGFRERNQLRLAISFIKNHPQSAVVPQAPATIGRSGIARRPSRLIEEYDFFDESREGPARVHIVPLGPQPLPVLFLNKLQLTQPDICSSTSRLHLFPPNAGNLLSALTEEETEKVNQGGILRVYASDGKADYELHLYQPESGSNLYVLGHEWGKMVAAHGLMEGDFVLAGWRRDSGQLCLAFQFVKKKQQP